MKEITSFLLLLIFLHSNLAQDITLYPCPSHRARNSETFTWKSTGVFFVYPNQGIFSLPGNFPVQIPVTYNYYADFSNGLTRSDYLDRDGEPVSLFQDYKSGILYNVSRGECSLSRAFFPDRTGSFQPFGDSKLVGHERVFLVWKNQTLDSPAVQVELTTDCVPLFLRHMVLNDNTGKFHDSWSIYDYSDVVNKDLLVIPKTCSASGSLMFDFFFTILILSSFLC